MFSWLGQIKAFGDRADRTSFKIEDRVVVHHGDPLPSTSYLRDTEFRIVSDVAYLVPIASNVPLKLAAMLGSRGLPIYVAVNEIRSYIYREILADNNNR